MQAWGGWEEKARGRREGDPPPSRWQAAAHGIPISNHNAPSGPAGAQVLGAKSQGPCSALSLVPTRCHQGQRHSQIRDTPSAAGLSAPPFCSLAPSMPTFQLARTTP